MSGGDATGNHLIHFRNTETESEFAKCNRCGHYELIDEGNREDYVSARNVYKEPTPEEVQAVLEEIDEYPYAPLSSRSIKQATAERFGVRVGVSEVDGSTPICHYYPKTHNGEIRGYKVRMLDPKYFYAVGNGRESDLFGINQARFGDVFTGKLFIFEDELSCMSGFEILVANSKTSYKPACVSLPDGAGTQAVAALSRNRAFVESFEQIVICMDNDEAGEDAVKKIRAIYPDIRVARVPRGEFNGKPVKDVNDMHMAGRGIEMFNALRYTASKETPAEAVSVMDCLADALKKPEWGLSYPWEGLTNLTYGVVWGEMISVGGGVGCGKTLIAHEMAAHFINQHEVNVGVFMLEESVGMSLKNIAGKSANIPFHLPDMEYDPEILKNEALKYDGKLWLYNNFGTNDWENIKQCIRYWVVENGCKLILLDNITALVAHLTPSEVNTEVSKIAAELAGMCQELEFTVMVFSHLNPASSGAPHEEGGQVKEVQFTGSRALMRWSQIILGFERNKQAMGNGKNFSLIRLMKDRKFGRTGMVYTKYLPETGRLIERKDTEVNVDSPFEEFDGEFCGGEDNERIF
ncbi:DNA primase/helicase [Vibrio phage vB_VpaP_SJSY21]|nr:DNA primase/helicase [Vibrio phage vB_VpaP_SJSY21]